MSSEDVLYGRWYNVSRDCLQSGSNEFQFNFAKVRKNDIVLIERCSFRNCRCIGAGREKGIKFATIRTMTGFQGHIDTSCLDVTHILEIHCPICHYQAVSEHEFFGHFVEEHMEPLLKNMIGNNPYSLRCPMVKCNHEKNKCFRDKEELAQMCVTQANKISKLEHDRMDWQRKIIEAEREKRDYLERLDGEQQAHR